MPVQRLEGSTIVGTAAELDTADPFLQAGDTAHATDTGAVRVGPGLFSSLDQLGGTDPTLDGIVTAEAFKATGEGTGGFTAGSRNLGRRTTAGFPTTGTFAAGDWGIDSLGRQIICVTAGTPGQWVYAGGTLLDDAVLTAAQGSITTVVDITGLSVTFDAPAQSVIVDLMVQGITNDNATGGWQVQIADAANAALVLARNPLVDAASSGETAPALKYLATGLTYGTSYTFKGRIARITAGTVAIAAATGGIAFGAQLTAVAA